MIEMHPGCFKSSVVQPTSNLTAMYSQALLVSLPIYASNFSNLKLSEWFLELL